MAAPVEQAERRIAADFLGAPLVLPVLTRSGISDAAYEVLLNKQTLGWFYQVVNGIPAPKSMRRSTAAAWPCHLQGPEPWREMLRRGLTATARAFARSNRA